MERGDDDDNFAEVVAVPEETLEDTNYVPPKPKPQPSATGGEPRRDLPGRDDLERQIARLTKAKEDTERRAQTAEEALHATQRRSTEEISRSRKEVAQSKRTTVETARSALETAIAENESALAAAKLQFRQAYDSGDGAALADAQARISDLTVAKHENSRRRDSLPSKEELDAEEEQITRPKDPAKMTPDERFEAYVSQFNPKAQTWLRKHPEFATSANLNRKLGRIHAEALEDEGLEENSDEYFDFINNRLGFSNNENDAGDDGGDNLRGYDDGARRRPQREERDVQRDRGSIEGRGSSNGARQYTENRNNRPMRSAPVRGGSDGNRSVNGRRTAHVGLTDGEIQQATDGTLVWGDHNAPRPELVGEAIGTTEFARRKMLMKKAGRYNMPSE